MKKTYCIKCKWFNKRNTSCFYWKEKRFINIKCKDPITGVAKIDREKRLIPENIRIIYDRVGAYKNIMTYDVESIVLKEQNKNNKCSVYSRAILPKENLEPIVTLVIMASALVSIYFLVKLLY